MGRGIQTRAGRSGAAGAVAAALAVSALTIALASAQAADRPVISGTPIVGETLTSSPPNGDSGIYKWQSCDPGAAVCGDDARNDPDWDDLPGAEGQHPQFQTYVVRSEDLGHYIRVLTHLTSEGSNSFVPSVPVGPVTATAAAPGPAQGPSQSPSQGQPIPQHGMQLVGQPASGVVKFKPPGAGRFSTLTGMTAIPVNSLIDTRQGSIVLTAATGAFGSQTPDDSAEFWDGVFKIKQSPKTDSIAVAKLAQKIACRGDDGEVARSKARRRAAGPVASASARRKRKLWGRGSGNYGTAGRGGTGSVVGTTWFTKDSCRGTKFKVTEGIGIEVQDGGKKIPLGPGESYFAER